MGRAKAGMIDRQFGKITFECDACPETLETDKEFWNAAMIVFRDAGWRSEKVGEEWTHLCPACNLRGKR